VHARVSMTEIQLLVLDEAHQLKGAAEYAILMKRFYSVVSPESRPRVLALTASPLSGRRQGAKTWEPAGVQDMRQELEDLENKADCRTWTELGLTEAAMAATLVEERLFDSDPEPHVEELVKMLESALASEAADVRKHQLQWNRALRSMQVLARDLGAWAALRGLEALCRSAEAEAEPEAGGPGDGLSRLLEEDSQDSEDDIYTEKVAFPRRAGIDGKEEIEAKQRLKQRLQRWEAEHAPVGHSAKVHAAIAKLKERFQVETDARCLVFTRTRVGCQLLACILQEEGTLPSVDFVVGANVQSGGYRVRQSQNVQKTALRRFGAQDAVAVSVLVATSVLAEGIDVPSCGLVLCFDPASSPLQHLQLRGRARLAGSEFTVLVPRGAVASAGPSLKDLQEYEDMVLDTLRTWPIRRQRDLPTAADGESFVVSSTGARMPIERAKAHLHTTVYGILIMAANGSDRELLDFCKPSFRDNTKKKKYGYSMFEVREAPGGFLCELELPTVGCCSLGLEEQQARASELRRSWWGKAASPRCQE
ncbi:unnamed protein product, partial [Effrenium voratum]